VIAKWVCFFFLLPAIFVSIGFGGGKPCLERLSKARIKSYGFTWLVGKKLGLRVNGDG